MAFSLGTSNPIVSKVASIELRASAFPLVYLGRLRLVVARRALCEAANISLWPVRGLRAGTNHFSKQINVIVSFARHRFANLVQDSQKFWATIHGKNKFEF